MHGRRRAGGAVRRGGRGPGAARAPRRPRGGGEGRMVPLTERIAGAPISWGVCEVPGWGFQLDPSLVLAQMRDVGLVATELGPEGFLPRDPQSAARTLRDAGLSAVGGFVPVVLHDPAHDPLPVVDA